MLLPIPALFLLCQQTCKDRGTVRVSHDAAAAARPACTPAEPAEGAALLLPEDEREVELDDDDEELRLLPDELLLPPLLLPPPPPPPPPEDPLPYCQTICQSSTK